MKHERRKEQRRIGDESVACAIRYDKNTPVCNEQDLYQNSQRFVFLQQVAFVEHTQELVLKTRQHHNERDHANKRKKTCHDLAASSHKCDRSS